MLININTMNAHCQISVQPGPMWINPPESIILMTFPTSHLSKRKRELNMSKIMDGKKVSQDIKEWIIRRTEELKDRTGIVPGLASILVGNDPASEIYVRNKRRACGRCGMLSEEYNLPEETSEEELLSLIERLNLDEKIHGILVQLPLPPRMNPARVIRKISPRQRCRRISSREHRKTVPGKPQRHLLHPVRNRKNSRLLRHRDTRQARSGRGKKQHSRKTRGGLDAQPRRHRHHSPYRN